MFINKLKTKQNSPKYWLGFMFREAGEVFEKMGCFLQGNLGYREQLNRSRRVLYFHTHMPEIHKSVFLSPSTTVIGNVSIKQNSSLWYNVVCRGDVNGIHIGEMTNIQDRVVIHCSTEDQPTAIGNRVTVEAGAILHSCTLEDESFVGIGTTVLDGARVSSRAIVGPCSLVPNKVIIPSGELWSGVPARKVRELTMEEQNTIVANAQRQHELAKLHKLETEKEFERLAKEIEETKYRDDKLAWYHYQGDKPIDNNLVR